MTKFLARIPLVGLVLVIAACGSETDSLGNGTAGAGGTGGHSSGGASGRGGASGGSGGSGTCAPLPCPAGAAWDPASCSCSPPTGVGGVATGSGGASGACGPLPCPSFAAWDETTCSCQPTTGFGGSGAGGDGTIITFGGDSTIGAGGDGITFCPPLPCPVNKSWNYDTCSCE